MFDVKILKKDLLKSLKTKRSLTINDEKFKITYINEKLLSYYEEKNVDDILYSLQLRKYVDEEQYLLYAQNIGNEYLYDGPIAYLTKK